MSYMDQDPDRTEKHVVLGLVALSTIVAALGFIACLVLARPSHGQTTHIKAPQRQTIMAAGLGVDGSANRYACGSFQGSLQVGTLNLPYTNNAAHSYCVSTDSVGNPRWLTALPRWTSADGAQPSQDSQQAFAMAATHNGAVYVGGLAYGKWGGVTIDSAGAGMLARLDGNGNVAWAKALGKAGGHIRGVATDGAKVCVTGLLPSAQSWGGDVLTPTDTDAVVACYSADDGRHFWSRKIDGPDFGNGWTIAIGEDGSVYAAGLFRDAVALGNKVYLSRGGYDVWAARFSGATGDTIWGWSGGSQYDDGVTGLAARAGIVALTGYAGGTLNFGGTPINIGLPGGIYLATLDVGTGLHSRSAAWRDPACVLGESSGGVAISSSGGTAITGKIVCNVDFGGGPLVGNGSYDLFAAVFHPDGTHSWSRRVVAPYDQSGKSLILDGALLVGGDFSRTFTPAGQPLTATGSNDSFVTLLVAPAVTPPPAVSTVTHTRTVALPTSTAVPATPSRSPSPKATETPGEQDDLPACVIGNAPCTLVVQPSGPTVEMQP